jgi:hypothetical protein
MKTISAASLGAPLDPFSSQTRQHIALVAFLAWIGLGADGLSSSCYGPEEAFLALGEHTHLALYMAAATALTVFVIAVGYNQVIELFPSGGGGYKVATSLIGPYTGLVSGAALIVDYMLTIAISVASGADAVFSLLPVAAQSLKLWTELGLVLLLLYLNLRGMRESIKVLLPIFLGFFVTHVVLILYGITTQAGNLPALIPETVQETGTLTQEMGASAPALSGLLIETSGSMMGMGACSAICAATSNCCATTAAIPSFDGRLMTERILVPKIPSFTARVRRASSAGIGFIRLTPSFSASSPLSTFKKGITPRSSHRKAGTGFSCTWPSIVPSKRIAAMTFAPVKAGAVMMRTRISCMSLNISASPL